MCTDPDAPRPILAPTCTGLADEYLNDEIINWIKNLEPDDPDDPEDPSDDDDDDDDDDDKSSNDLDKGVIAAIAVLGTLSLGLAVALVVVIFRRVEKKRVRHTRSIHECQYD